MKNRIFSGAPSEDFAGYAKAVIDGRWVHVSGSLGQDPETGVMPDDVTAQTQNIFHTLEMTLEQASSQLADVVRCRVYITDGAYLKDVARVLGEKFANIRPANTLLICQIPTPGAKVEIEVTAARPAA